MAWYTVPNSAPIARIVEFMPAGWFNPLPRDERDSPATIGTDGMHELHYIGLDLYVDYDRTCGLRTHDVGYFKTHRAARDAWRSKLRRGEL